MTALTRSLLALLFLAVCSTSVLAETKLATDVNASDAYVRVPIPGRNLTAAFFTLNNQGAQAVELVAAHADFAARTELHTHTHSDGMMRMRKVDSVSIPAKGQLAFEPGSYHVMLYELKHTVQTGDKLELMLEFADGRRLLVPAVVRSTFDNNHSQHNHSHH